MSLLLLDVGNSRLKWALADNGRFVAQGAVAHAGDPAAALATLPTLQASEIRIANVTGDEHAARIALVLLERYALAARYARSEAQCNGLRSAYAQAERLGVDRWLSMLALWGRGVAPFAVASAGTALTFDAVDADGQHLGGVIAPGLLTAQQAVLGATRFAAAGPDQHYGAGLGRDTEACVRQGALHAAAGLLERLARQQATARCYLAGGDAAVLRPQLEGDWQLAPDLVLEGLMRLPPASRPNG